MNWQTWGKITQKRRFSLPLGNQAVMQGPAEIRRFRGLFPETSGAHSVGER